MTSPDTDGITCVFVCAHAQAQHSSGEESRPPSWGTAGAIVLATVSSLVFFLTLVGVALWRRRRGLRLGDVIALEDLRDPESKCRLLSSIRRQLPSSASDDGVFLMVYLPSPYEGALSRIARAASAGSADDADQPPSPRLLNGPHPPVFPAEVVDATGAAPVGGPSKNIH